VVKVAKQVVSFDQEINELMREDHSDDKLIEKARRIHSSLAAPAYFNDLLTVCEMVKTESARWGSSISLRQRELRAGLDNLARVQQLIADKQEAMGALQLHLEQTNAALEDHCSELEQINARITDWQMTASAEELSSEGLCELRVQREEIETELKAARERKERLEAEKKKLLKSVKIGNDYLEVFAHSPLQFELQLERTAADAALL
jgi:chromosome segregation ATPase